ncbi:MAG: hypothetical protein R2792_03795 [Saprospiraceae bacterium]
MAPPRQGFPAQPQPGQCIRAVAVGRAYRFLRPNPDLFDSSAWSFKHVKYLPDNNR